MIRMTKNFYLAGCKYSPHPLVFALFMIVGIAACAVIAHAQGSRRDDIVFNAQGRPMAGAAVRICTSAATGQPCAPLAQIYSDAALTQALTNPLSADGLGNYSFYASPGRYMIEISGPGITTKQIPNVILPSDPSSPTFTSVTTTSGISAFSLSLTGNLTVNGSTAVAGSLTVGGAPVPTTNADNQWTAGQRFKGPIPYRDVTAYMPAGGCSSTIAQVDPPTTGSISTGSPTLTLANARDFKNGCGIAVLGAGPSSTQPPTNGGCTISSIAVAANVVTVTCSAAHNIPVGTLYQTGVVISGVTNPAFNGTFPVTSVADTTHFTYALTLANTSSSGGSATTQWGYTHGYPSGLGATSIVRASNVTTVILQTSLQQLSQYTNATITGTVDGTFNVASVAITVLDNTRFTYANTGSDGSSSGAIVALEGGTTFNYKVSACDSYGGCSAASPTITISKSLATLTNDNYNWLTWSQSALGLSTSARMYVIWGDKGLGGAYSCVGTAFTEGYSDFGLPMPCPAFAPATPPGAATAQMLNTTISAGGGTTTVTLAANASTTVSAVNVYHDESSFMNACLADISTDRYGAAIEGSSYGCYLPPTGMYFFNGRLLTDIGTPGTVAGNIRIAGSIFFNTLPWIFSSGPWNVQGEGFSGTRSVFSHKPVTTFRVGSNVPAAVVFRYQANNTRFSGFDLFQLPGHGIWLGAGQNSGGPNGFDISNLMITENSNGGGAPLYFGNNIITTWVDSVEMSPRQTGGLPSVMFSGDGYNGAPDCCFNFSNIQSVFRGIRFQAPGGNGTGGGDTNINMRNWIHESQQAGYGGFIEYDGSASAPGTLNSIIPLNGLTITNLDNSDPLGVVTMFQYTGLSQGNVANVSTNYVNDFSGLLSCSSHSTACGYPASPFVGGISAPNEQMDKFWGVGFGSGNAIGANGAFYLTEPLLTGTTPYGPGLTPLSPIWAAPLPQLYGLQINSTGAGSLSAANYCIVVEGKDAQTVPGLTLPSNEVCVNLGASSAVTLQWQQAGNALDLAYSGFRILYGTTPGGENNYIDVAAGTSPYVYNFTSTAGAVGGTPQSVSTAYLSWMYWQHNKHGCIYCTSSGGSTSWALGVGEPNPAAGVKLDVKGGTLRGQGGVQAGTDTAFNASPRGAYNAFLPNLTSAAATYQRMTLDKAITVTRFQVVLGTAGAGCTTQSTVSVTDGTNSVTLTTANGTAIYDSGAVSQNFAAAANLDIKIATAASGCTTAPQNANVTAQYRMQ